MSLSSALILMALMYITSDSTYLCVSGRFEVLSATVNHYRNGMRANYSVEKCSMFQRQGEVMLHSKTYYIAAVETDWDYSPNRTFETEMFRGGER